MIKFHGRHDLVYSGLKPAWTCVAAQFEKKEEMMSAHSSTVAVQEDRLLFGDLYLDKRDAKRDAFKQERDKGDIQKLKTQLLKWDDC